MLSGTWKFDTNTALDFENIARTNIPHYEEVIGKCVRLAEHYFPDKSAPRIIDVGSALGYTMERLSLAGFTDVYGVENSPEMAAQSRMKEHVLLSETLPKELAPYHFIIANWTLHFVQDRKAYIQDVFDALDSGGIFILSDKMSSSELTHEMYHNFKRDNGLSEEQIAKKAQQIQGVLNTKPPAWYLETLEDVGFAHVEIIDSSWCFKSLLCRKSF